ncbi:MAG: helix-turn-helix transcriptional regulator [Chlorobi bacterium]|nr:helix-turn-helix transcriptional regulator [Chlorobiota bacterium]
MKKTARENKKVYHIRNLLSKGASILLKEKLEELGYNVVKVEPGIIEFDDVSGLKEEELRKVLNRYGFDIIKDKDQLLVEEIKQAVIELIHHMNNMNSVVRKSEYLVEKLGKSYSHLSRVFSTYEPITLEKYIILQKIERIKELLDENELTLSEIAYMMDYSSVQYLSNQFKKITGVSVTEYKNSNMVRKKFIDEVDKIEN